MTRRTPAQRRARGRVPRRGALRGRGRPGRARRPLRRPRLARAPSPGWSSSGTRCPGERVVLEITEGTEGDRVLARRRRRGARGLARPGRPPPCPYAGPGRCGGCDFQHVDLAAQRALKAAVVHEQLSRLARLDVPVTVEPVAGDEDGLRWRTRRAVRRPAPDGDAGMRKHRSPRGRRRSTTA